MSRKPLTPVRALRIIMVVTLLVTLAGGVLMWLVDHDEFPDLGTAMWWSLQTVTTVGYGDVVPSHTWGRLIAAVVMLQGIAFITIIAATVTATLIDQLRRRRADPEDALQTTHLEQIETRLAAIEQALADRQDPPRP